MSLTKDDVTDEQLKMVELLKAIKIEKVEELETVVKSKVVTAASTSSTEQSHIRLSTFFGDASKGQPIKGEVSYESFKYEVECLIHAGKHTEDAILMAVRRACKGAAADILRRMGYKATLKEIIGKLDSTYSIIETGESVLRKFYSSSQEPTESVSIYAERVENLFSQACDLGVLLASQQVILKNVLFQGLLPQLRQMASLKFELIKDYDAFKIELRKIEGQAEVDRSKSKAQCQAGYKSEDGLEKVSKILEKMDKRIEELEKRQQDTSFRPQMQDVFRGSSRGRGAWRGQRFDRPRGRGTYQPQRPTAASTFRPRGHVPIRCYRCGTEGHKMADCPK